MASSTWMSISHNDEATHMMHTQQKEPALVGMTQHSETAKQHGVETSLPIERNHVTNEEHESNRALHPQVSASSSMASSPASSSSSSKEITMPPPPPRPSESVTMTTTKSSVAAAAVAEDDPFHTKDKAKTSASAARPSSTKPINASVQATSSLISARAPSALDTEEDSPERSSKQPSANQKVDHQSKSTNATNETKKKSQVDKKREPNAKERPHKAGSSWKRLFRDAITVHIPLEGQASADLGVAMQRSRTKQRQALVQAFVFLQEKDSTGQSLSAGKGTGGKEEDEDEAVDESMAGDSTAEKDPKTGTEDGAANKKKGKKAAQVIQRQLHIPQRCEYSSVLDYLEAKYVQGVMIDDEKFGRDTDGGEDDEGQGSVYSDASSFLDDKDLQRTVAEQVLAHTTTTKLELQQENQDEFFVNVGQLEVEETPWTQDKYDPLQDTAGSKGAAATKKKKRKKPSETNATATTAKTAAATKCAGAGGATTSSGPVAKKAPSSPSKKKASSNKPEDGPPKKKAKTAGDSASTVSGKKGSSEADSKVSKKTEAKKKEKTTTDIAVKKEKIDASSSTKGKAANPATVSSSATVPVAVTADQKLLEKKAKSRRAKSDKIFQQLADLIKKAKPEELPRRKTKTRVTLTCPPDRGPGGEVTFTNPLVPGQKLKAVIPKSAKPGGTFKVTVPAPKKPADEDNTKDHNTFGRDFYEVLDDYARAYDEWCDAEGDFRKACGGEAAKSFAPHQEKRQKFEQLIKVFPKDLMTPIDKPYMQKILRRARQNKHKREQTLARQQKTRTSSSDEDVRKSPVPQPTRKALIPILSTHFAERVFRADEFRERQQHKKSSSNNNNNNTNSESH